MVLPCVIHHVLGRPQSLLRMLLTFYFIYAPGGPQSFPNTYLMYLAWSGHLKCSVLFFWYENQVRRRSQAP